MCKSSFTVFFADPFWVGVYEREEEGRLHVCKVVFGAEPKDAEVYLFLLDNWAKLVFGPPVELMQRQKTIRNPKRKQRAIAKQLVGGVGTKAQQAIKLAQQQGKQERKTQTQKKKQEEQERQFTLRTQKKKEKHKGH